MLDIGLLRRHTARVPMSDCDDVKLSYWVFVLWWFIILGVHVVTCIYNALYAYCYWKLKDTYLNVCLEFYKIGMQQQYQNPIALVHANLSGIHAVCILLMISGSLWQCAFTFTPWTPSMVTPAAQPGPSSSMLKSLKTIYDKVTCPCSLFGVKGKYFELALISREVVETALQTVQAYRMSALLPRTLLNRFYVILLAINCWSSPLIDIAFHKQDEARRRFACIVLDCLLDLMTCMGIQLIVLLAYVNDYDPDIQGFDGTIWYNDEWVARALNEFQIVVVVSWSDLVSRIIFSLSLLITTISMKTLICYLPRNNTRVSQIGTANAIVVAQKTHRQVSTLQVLPADGFTRQQSISRITFRNRTIWSSLYGRRLHLAAHGMFGVWGVVILGLHIHASTQPSLPQCLMQVRPWTATRPFCYLAGLDCYTLGISGKTREVEEQWSEFDSTTVVQLLVRHCPELAVPDIFSDFHRLRGIKVYNTTITDWGESAAITNTNHPQMSTLYVVRVNMTGGILPAGFQSDDFPQSLNDIEICVTNLRDLPSDLDTKWVEGAIIQVEYSQLESLPLALARLKPYYLYLTGNPLSYVPTEFFGVDGMVYLGIGDMNISELPPDVSNVSASLALVQIDNTNISFFWSWVDELVGRAENPALLVAGGSTYCDNLKQIEENKTDSFHVPRSSQYSSVLMDPSKSNQHQLLRVVDCDSSDKGPYYPLALEDTMNAISTPPSLFKGQKRLH
ncbi:unnamed protein product [Phytophthora fragariaefolia]|uniref:Unnamed protein product n=1 Tax=Phytophthora fragariaefolia TaxID=1490495 RepID=A0A9W6YH01_9STRA|nr:unnamed protein product [Phytophthora fragariaefolia]